MKYYCVTSQFFDNGKIDAWITVHNMPEMPQNNMEEHKKYDLYFDHFKTKTEAVLFFEETLRA